MIKNDFGDFVVVWLFGIMNDSKMFNMYRLFVKLDLFSFYKVV